MVESLSLVAKCQVHLPSTAKISRSIQTYRGRADEKTIRERGKNPKKLTSTHFQIQTLKPCWVAAKEITAIPAVMAKIEEETSEPESFMSSVVITYLFVQHRWRGHTVSSSWDSKATLNWPCGDVDSRVFYLWTLSCPNFSLWENFPYGSCVGSTQT